MVCERRTPKNEIFNMSSNIDNINEELRNIGEWNEDARIRERRRMEELRRMEERMLFCYQFNVFPEDCVLFMDDEEFIRFKDIVLKHYGEHVIAYCHRHEITYEKVLLNTPNDLFDEMLANIEIE